MATKTPTPLRPPDESKPGDDALGEPEDDEEAEKSDRDAIARLDAAVGSTSGEGDPAFQRIDMGATLQDAKVSAAQNGDNYDVKFEIGIAGWVKISESVARGKGGFSVTFAKLIVGNGGEIRRGTMSRDADGAMHYYVNIHFAQSEIARSLGRMGTMLRQHALLQLDPEQGELGLADGSKVDLTKRA